jgi:hypothetical protein
MVRIGLPVGDVTARRFSICEREQPGAQYRFVRSRHMFASQLGRKLPSEQMLPVWSDE